MQMLIWGFFVPTILLYHATFAVNSISHLFGSRQFNTKDKSKNNWLVAIFTFGEGWHNNHHFFPGSARQGFFKDELDITYYGLKLLSLLGLVRDLRPVPVWVKEKAIRNSP
jgi:stearoyl-CoA desaturase (delta-9 desaturase)